MRRKIMLVLLVLLLGTAAHAFAGEAILTVNAGEKLHAMSQTLYGVFFEDINHAADGGLYAELLNNRSFEQENLLDPQRFDHYTGWQFNFGGGKGKIALQEEEPLNANNPHYVRFTVSEAGYQAANAGFGASTVTGGISVKSGMTYDFYVWLRSADYTGTVTAALMDRQGTLYSDVLTFTPGEEWTRYTGLLNAEVPEGTQAAYLVFTFNGTGTVDLDMASLMPADRIGSTWPGGGVRRDLTEALKALHPRFLRFPGGCVAEGSYVRSNFYNWKDTVGPVEERKENYNTWGYMQSYGLGFYEYFCLCEEIGALPLPVVHAGLLCQSREAQEAPIPMDELDAYVQDVLDLIEFARGGTDTVWGALRAEMGHPEPFDLRWLAIGNENWGDVYFKRYAVISEAVKEAWPDITTIVAAGPVADNSSAWSVIRSRYADSMVDEHYYMDSDWFPAHVSRYDSYPRTTQVFLGEYAAHEEAVSGRRPNNLYSALCEAAYLTGIERNSDVVAMCCYAPLLARSGMDQWTPDLIWFDADSVLLTPNYYIQQMFSATLGTSVVSSELSGAELYQVATRTGNCLYVKVVNLSGEPCRLTLLLDQVPDGEASLLMLSGESAAVNSFAAPETVTPVSEVRPVSAGVLTDTLPGYAAAIYSIPLE